MYMSIVHEKNEKLVTAFQGSYSAGEYHVIESQVWKVIELNEDDVTLGEHWEVIVKDRFGFTEEIRQVETQQEAEKLVRKLIKQYNQ